jgi:hypothetical protein
VVRNLTQQGSLDSKLFKLGVWLKDHGFAAPALCVFGIQIGILVAESGIHLVSHQISEFVISLGESIAESSGFFLVVSIAIFVLSNSQKLTRRRR